jgi:hypothetical protein
MATRRTDRVRTEYKPARNTNGIEQKSERLR